MLPVGNTQQYQRFSFLCEQIKQKKKKRPKQYALDLNLRLLLSFFLRGRSSFFVFEKNVVFLLYLIITLPWWRMITAIGWRRKTKQKPDFYFIFFFWVETKESRQEFSPSKCCVRDKKGDEDNE